MKRNIITIINLLLLVMSTGNMYALERGNRIYSNVQFETGNIEKTNEVVQTRSIDVKCEGNNKQLKPSFKKKEQFPTEKSEEKYLVIQFNRYNEKNMNHVHRGFGQTTREDWFKS